MLFQVYGENAVFQWLGLLLVFGALIGLNEVARRSKLGGLVLFAALPAVLTVYFVAVAVGAALGAGWALNNPTYLYQNSWFHYAKLYAALAGCIGFMIIKYRWGYLGRARWFKVFPFAIVAVNILIAVVSDFESAVRAWGTTWVTSEGVELAGGWHNVLNGVAGLMNVMVMTGWFGIYVSRDRRDMLWPDMTFVFIISYDLWNFCYTYNCLPTHSWYAGVALLLAPTVANALWNKGAWIQNRAFTLALWCMFCQVLPMFADSSVFAVDSVNNPAVNLGVSIVALAANAAALAYVVWRAWSLRRNPYTCELFVGTRDYEQAIARAELPRSPR
jgi:hypothetical protein